ncbi:MAG: ankyrin repeat domain-containing protein [Burkholderiales bacterium]|nr:MAG: ankyrin repeat domain-containing protein [Burkholderiales bacterium]
MHRYRTDLSIRALRGAATAILVAVLAACTTTAGPSAYDQLRGRIATGDLVGADALIAASAGSVDARRALDIAIRSGRLDATRHYVARVGPDVELDPDATTPLIRAVVDAPPSARPALVAALREAGADPTRRDRYGRDALSYATARGSLDLQALLQTSPAPSVVVVDAPPAFAAWLGAGTGGATVLAAAALGVNDGMPERASGRPLPSTRQGGSARPPASAAGAAAVQAGASPDSAAPASRKAPAGTATRTRPDASGRAARAMPPIPLTSTAVPPPLSSGVLLRGSPWRPTAASASPGQPQAAVRFHADGTADVLRIAAGAVRPEPLPGTYAAWRIDDGRLRLAIVGDAFAAGCIGGAAPAYGSESDQLALSCEPLPPPAPVAGAGWSQDLARAMLDEIDAPRAVSIVALATGRDTIPDTADAPNRVLPVALHRSAPGATCKPARTRPRAAVPSPRVLGDWLAMGVRRFDVVAPLSGSICPQTVARDAAMKACRQDAGRGARASAACRSVGGCPVGQTSALAGLPGVEAGWVACDTDPGAARRKALEACRADLGCDCQLVALSGRNMVADAGSAACRAPRR